MVTQEACLQSQGHWQRTPGSQALSSPPSPHLLPVPPGLPGEGTFAAAPGVNTSDILQSQVSL